MQQPFYPRFGKKLLHFETVLGFLSILQGCNWQWHVKNGNSFLTNRSGNPVCGPLFKLL